MDVNVATWACGRCVFDARVQSIRQLNPAAALAPAPAPALPPALPPGG